MHVLIRPLPQPVTVFPLCQHQNIFLFKRMSKAKALIPKLRRKRDIRFPGIWVGLVKPRCIVGFTGIFNMAAKRDKVNKLSMKTFLSLVQFFLFYFKKICLFCYSKQLLTGNQFRENRCKYSKNQKPNLCFVLCCVI